MINGDYSLKHGSRYCIPLWLKLSFTVFITVWTPLYWRHYGPENFLWFCDLANFLIALALWLESPLLMCSQGISIILIQILWAIDVLGRALLGIHMIGGTEYMFDPVHPLSIRFLSLFHFVTPPLIIWAVWRLGYDRRGLLLQTVFAWIILPVCFFLTGPDRNINWVWGLFGKTQTAVHPYIYFIALMLGYPLIVYFPTHLLLSRLFSKKPK
jgi:hypothetical protein